VSKQGFKKASQQAFQLFVNQTATFDFVLSVGAIDQTITVTGSTAQLEFSTSELGSVINQTFVNNLPLNGRQFTALLALTPGASPANTSQNRAGGQAYPVGPVVIPATNGQQNRSNLFMIDGINATEGTFSTYSLAPVVDDIQEFKVQSHNDEAQYGGVTGGIINVVTKSGSNQFHGAAWEYVRNDFMDARNPFAQEVAPLKQNMFGVNVGGPVIIPKLYNGRNKTFFFISYEGFRRSTNTGLGGLAITPTEAQLAGDLSDLSSQLFNPFSTRPDPGNPGQAIRDPFLCDSSGNPLPTAAGGTQSGGTPCNKIPSTLLNPNMVKFAQLVFPPAGPPILGLYNSASKVNDNTNQDQYNARLDHSFNDHNSVWFRYSWNTQIGVSPGGFDGVVNKHVTPSKNWGLNYLHTFNPTTLMNVQFGHTDLHNLNGSHFGGDATSIVEQTNFSQDFACAFSVGCIVPYMDIPGFITGGDSLGYADPLSDLYVLKGDFTKVVGNHTFKTGAYWETSKLRQVVANAIESFSSAQTADPQAPGTGSPLASFLLGAVDNVQQRSTSTWIKGQNSYGFFFQDQWLVTRKLTANLGLRWEYLHWPRLGLSSDNTDAIGELDLSNGTYLLQRAVGSCEELGKAPCIPGGLPQPNLVVSPDGHLWRSSKDNFQPRIGLAYRLNDQTALRGGFGIFFDEGPGVMQQIAGLGNVWPSVGALGLANLNSAVDGPPATTAEDPLISSGGGGLPPPSPFTQAAWYRDPHAENAYSEQWNFGVQRQLGSNTIEADYVGSHSSRLTVGIYGNVAVTPGPGDPALRQPYPYITPSFYDRSIGRSSYNAFQFKISNRMTHGLQYQLSYTWSKAINVGCDGFFSVEGCAIQDPYHLDGDRSVAGFDLPQVVTFNWVYQLPRLTSNNALGALLNNWQVNGILIGTSGLSYDVGISGDIANTGNSYGGDYYERLNLVGDPKLSNPSPQLWFNPAAFAVPDPFTFGNLGRNSLRQDGLFNLDLGVSKRFRITEGTSLELRGEAFNATNTPTWGKPRVDFNDPQFGQIFRTRSIERQLQIAVKFYF